MTHPAVIVATGAVALVAAIVAVVVSLSEKPQTTSYGRRTRNDSIYVSPSPPSTRRRKSSSKRLESSCQIPNCVNCDESPFVELFPCGHTICRTSFHCHFKTNHTCPVCSDRIDSCTPPVSSFGKCNHCTKFTKLIQALPCHHSSCDNCFVKQMKGNKCLECGFPIHGKKEQERNKTGDCLMCGQFTWLSKFQTCGHGEFCKEDALKYLEKSGNECNVCGEYVKSIVD